MIKMADWRLSGQILKPFTGEGDVVKWLAKLKMVAKLQKIEDVVNLLPLYLEGEALAIYQQMREADKDVLAQVEQRLKLAFAEGPFEALEKLASLRWTGESVDVFASEIRRLAGLAGYVGRSLELTVKLYFVNGFPEGISTDLQRLTGISNMEVDELLVHVRVLAKRGNKQVAAAAASGSGCTGLRPTLDEERQTARRQEGRYVLKCFRCQGPHLIRDCKEQKPGITCYRCGRAGHISKYCGTPRDQGNE